MPGGSLAASFVPCTEQTTYSTLIIKSHPMTAIANFSADLMVDYQIYATMTAFLEGKEAGALLHELFPFGMVYETLERTFAQNGYPDDVAVLPETTLSATAPSVC